MANFEEDPLPFANCAYTESLFLPRSPPPRYRSLSPPHKGTQTACQISTSSSESLAARPRRRRRQKKRSSSTGTQNLRTTSPRVQDASPFRHLERGLAFVSFVTLQVSSWTGSMIAALLAPSLPLILTIALPSIAIIYIYHLLSPFTTTLGSFATAISDISPSEIFESVWNPTATALSTISVSALWCKGVGIGCSIPNRDSPFHTAPFQNLPTTPPPSVINLSDEVSAGNDFFDCLHDLRATRAQKVAASHLITLASKVMQWEHLLEDAEELSGEIRKLGVARTSIIMNANAARVTGGSAVKTLITEFERTRFISSTRTSDKHLSALLSHLLTNVQGILQASSDYTIDTSQAVKSAEAIAKSLSALGHKEISRLRRINNEQTQGLKWVAWKWLQPGAKNQVQERIQAAEFLKEVLKVVDSGVVVLMTSSMSLQQCAINTKDFSTGLERALTHGYADLDLRSKIGHLATSVEGLEVRLTELRSKDEPLSISEGKVKSQDTGSAGRSTT